MNDENKAYQATPAKDIRDYIMNPCIAKSEAEWWASIEITRLEEIVNNHCSPNQVELLRLEQKIEGLTGKAQALVSQMNLIHNDNRYTGVWSFYQIHGCTYNGPTYEKEFKDLSDYLLTQSKKDEEPTNEI